MKKILIVVTLVVAMTLTSCKTVLTEVVDVDKYGYVVGKWDKNGVYYPIVVPAEQQSGPDGLYRGPIPENTVYYK